MGGRTAAVVGSGFKPLDRELPGGGWPTQALTEVLVEPGAHCEWRLLAPALRRIQKRGEIVFMVGTPHTPHLPGLRLVGIDERRLVWVKVDSHRERLWAIQQIIQSGQAGAVMAWLPQVDARSLRRLQACTQACEAPIFLMRPSSMQHETSPAPLRVEAMLDEVAWNLRLRVLKRRGPQLERIIELPSVPGGLTQVLARRAATLVPRIIPVAVPVTRRTPLPRPVPIPIPIIPISRPPSTPVHASQEPIDELLAGAVLPPLLRVVAH